MSSEPIEPDQVREQYESIHALLGYVERSNDLLRKALRSTYGVQLDMRPLARDQDLIPQLAYFERHISEMHSLLETMIRQAYSAHGIWMNSLKNLKSIEP